MLNDAAVLSEFEALTEASVSAEPDPLADNDSRIDVLALSEAD